MQHVDIIYLALGGRSMPPYTNLTMLAWINYVNVQHNYVNMQPDYINIQHNFMRMLTR